MDGIDATQYDLVEINTPGSSIKFNDRTVEKNSLFITFS